MRTLAAVLLTLVLVACSPAEAPQAPSPDPSSPTDSPEPSTTPTAPSGSPAAAPATRKPIPEDLERLARAFIA